MNKLSGQNDVKTSCKGVRLEISTDCLIDDPYITSQDNLVGVVDLSDDFIGDGEGEQYYLEVGMYPWYGTCGKILKIKEIEV